MGADLPYDGDPETGYFSAPGDSMPLAHYFWAPAGGRFPKGILVIQHGVTAHTRLTWCMKKMLEKPRWSVREFTCAPVETEKPESVPLNLSPALTTTTASTGTVSSASSDLESLVAHGSASPASSSAGGRGTGLGRHRSQDSRLSGDTCSSDNEKALIKNTAFCSTDFRESCFVRATLTRQPLTTIEYSKLRVAGTYADPAATVPQDDLCRHVFFENSWIEGFTNAGYGVYGLDLRGHGRSGGPRCHTPDYDLYRDDLIEFITTLVKSRFPTTPIFLVGISISAWVVLRVLQDPRCPELGLSGAVCLSAMAAHSNRLLRFPYGFIARFNYYVLSRLRPSTGLVRLDAGPDWAKAVGQNDPYRFSDKATSWMVKAAMVAVTRMRRDLPGKCKPLPGKFRLPSLFCSPQPIVALDSTSSPIPRLLIIHNKADTVCPLEGSLYAFTQLAKRWRKGDFDLTCVILNAGRQPHNQEEAWPINEQIEKEALKTAQETKQRIVLDYTPLNIGHTMVNELDGGYGFGLVLDWLEKTKTSSDHSAVEGADSR